MRRFPQHAYNPEDPLSSLRKLIESILVELNISTSNIDRIYDGVGINTAQPDDIYSRFGALLNITKNNGETDEQYRERLKVSVIALSGGTADAIKYAIACGLGINNDNEAMNRIQIYDAWDYDGEADINKDYGYIVCTIDLNNGIYSSEFQDIVASSADNVKAAGTIIQFIYYNYRVIYYIELDDITYASLNTLEYNKVGE
jgi:hypothetical protein